MSSTPIDHQAIGRSRVATQYTESTRFLAWLRALLAPADDIEHLLQKAAEQTDIDLAEGVNLDVIGEIVGISRIIPEAIALPFFGFENQPGAETFGEEQQPGIGARFREETESWTAQSVLSDIEYRMLIRAKIIRNHAIGTNEDIMRGMRYLLDTPHCATEDTGGMRIGLSIGRAITFREKTIITAFDLLPRPAGVRIDWRITFDAENYFGFDDQPGAKPFGEEGQTGIGSPGGLFAEEF